MMKKLSLIAVVLSVLTGSAAEKNAKPSREELIKPVKIGELRVEPMFASAGITYGSLKKEGLAFEYRRAPKGFWQKLFGGDDWQTTFAPYWFDEVNNYRGMAWYLDEDTDYQLRVTADGKTLAETTFRTWASEVPIAKTVYLDETTKFPLTVSDKGTATGWVRYTTKPGTVLRHAPKKPDFAMITVKDAAYVLFDDMTIVGGDVRSVILINDSQYVRIRNCDISGWGHLGVCRLDFAGRYYAGNAWDKKRNRPGNGNGCNGINIGKGTVGAVVERCYIHDPVARSTTWRHSHPAGAFAVVASKPDHSTSLRYNDLVGSDACRWDDCVGSGGNFDVNGGLNRTAEVYGNFMIFPNDDCIELDGGQQNMACFKNRFEGALVGVSIQGNVVSPSFTFDNLFSGMCEERGEPGQTVKTSGYDLFGQGPFAAVMNNVFWGRGSGIGVNVIKSGDPNHASSNAGRVGGIDVLNNIFCGKQSISSMELNPKGRMVGNTFGATLAEKDLDRALPYRPLPFLLDTCVIDAGRNHADRYVRVEGGDGMGFKIVKNTPFDWFDVEPKEGVLKDGMAFTVRFRKDLKEAPVYRGAFLVRTANGLSRPVSVYARTNWAQPEKCDKPGTVAVYAHPKDGVKDKDGFMVYTFDAPKDGRYFFHVFAKADRRPVAIAAVDDEKPGKFTVQTCWQYPVWSVICPDRPMWSIFPGRLKHYDLKAGKHTLRIKRAPRGGDFKPQAYVMTDHPLDFEPLIDFCEKE